MVPSEYLKSAILGCALGCELLTTLFTTSLLLIHRISHTYFVGRRLLSASIKFPLIICILHRLRRSHVFTRELGITAALRYFSGCFPTRVLDLIYVAVHGGWRINTNFEHNFGHVEQLKLPDRRYECQRWLLRHDGCSPGNLSREEIKIIGQE